MHLSLRLVDYHLLAFILENFHGKVTMIKPLTEFAMRKTCWLYAEGFDPAPDAIERLEELVKETKEPPYDDNGPNTPKGELNNSILMRLTTDELIAKYGKRMADILDPMWKSQADTLEDMMRGKTDRVCNRCRSGKKYCKRCESTIPKNILEAVTNVSSRLEKTNRELLLS
jgi:hypothetical protein